MNMAPTSTHGLRAGPTPCFCGQLCPPESYYCSPHCAREDAFNALTLGQPHESSKPPMVPLPTLPKDFFKLPPKRSLDEADELVFTSCDHGPFQSKDRMTRNLASVPRSIATSVASTAPSKRSKWRSHYQHTQQRKSLDESIDLPFFLVDEAESGKDQKVVGVSAALDIGSSGQPTPTAEPRQQATELGRTGSFGIISPTYVEANTLTPYASMTDTSTRHYQRSSSSSYNSLLTSATSRSRCSYTSATVLPDPSPTSSEYPPSIAQSQPRLGYGSAFGGNEEKMLTLDVARMAEDVQNSLLLVKRASRKRSSTDATLLPVTTSQQDSQRKEWLQSKEDTPAKPSNSTPTSVARHPRATSPKKANTSVPRSQWPQFGISASRSDQRLIAAAPPLPSQMQATSTSVSRSVPGTMVKKTTLATKGRLPIGTPQQAPPRPKTPSNTLPAGINLSLHSKSFCAPAYAMSAPKITGSTRPLRTSPSKKSLKAQKEQGHVQIPPMDADDCPSLREVFKPSFEPMPSTGTGDFKGPDTLIVNEENLTSSAQTGSLFKLSTPPKSQRSLNLTLNLDCLDPSSISSSEPTPRASPSGAHDRSPSTVGGPLTPRVTPIGNQCPEWPTSPIDCNVPSAKADFYMPMAVQRTPPLGSST